MEPSVLSPDVDSAVVERRRRRARDVRVAPPQRTRALVQRNESGPHRQIDGPMGEGRGRGDLVCRVVLQTNKRGKTDGWTHLCVVRIQSEVQVSGERTVE